MKLKLNLTAYIYQNTIFVCKGSDILLNLQEMNELSLRRRRKIRLSYRVI